MAAKAVRVLLALVLVLGIAGTATGAYAAESTSVQLRNDAQLGDFLTDSNGMTLYVFKKDTAYQSNCSGGCADNWPPLLLSGDAPVAGEGVTGLLGVIVREDGGRQVVYNGMPLYHWVGDDEPGDTYGQGINDVWFVATVAAADAALTPSVKVNDQQLMDGSVTISNVVATEPGWLVIHADNDGSPGAVLGYVAVNPGENTNVKVDIDTQGMTPKLYAMLHVDRGMVGTYEFPGADKPAQVAGGIVNVGFKLAESETTSPAVTESLPNTGGPTYLVLVVVGMAIILAGVVVQRAFSHR